MQRAAHGEGGAALLTVLAFLTLLLILATSMLALTGNELLIARMQRDGMKAFALAQSAQTEAVHRMEQGHPYVQGFSPSLEMNGSAQADLDVFVARRSVGINTAYAEIRADARVGAATRRMSTIVLLRSELFAPNAVLAGGLIQQDTATITCGDIYSRSFVRYRTDPNRVPARCASEPGQPPSLTYAAWRVSGCADPDGQCADGIPPCDRAPCPPHPDADTSKWYPATRMAEAADSITGQELAGLVTSCPSGGGGSLPGTVISGRLAGEQEVTNAPQYGFDSDDPDGSGPVPPQAVIPGILPCGMPYKYELVAFTAEDGRTIQRFAKKILFAHWWSLYWRFDERRMSAVKRSNLLAYPQFGAIPPLPRPDSITTNFDCWKGGGGTLQGSLLPCDRPADRTSGLGCKSPQMVCSPAEDLPVGLVLEGDWTASGVQGAGTLVVDGDLTANGAFDYWGLVVATGRLSMVTSGAVIHGGVVSFGVLRLGGSAVIEGGGMVPSIPVGRTVVSRRGWWER